MFAKRIGLVVDSEYAYLLLPKAGPDATPIKGLPPTDSPKLLIDALWGGRHPDSQPQDGGIRSIDAEDGRRGRSVLLR